MLDVLAVVRVRDQHRALVGHALDHAEGAGAVRVELHEAATDAGPAF